MTPDYRARVPAVVFVAPYFLPTTSRFIAATASIPGVSLGLVSADPAEKIPREIRPLLSAHYRVENALDPSQLLPAVRSLGAQLGGVDRILGPLEELQVPMAQVRAELSVDGVDVETARNFRDKDRMKKVMSAHGLPCAKHRLVGSAEEAWDFSSPPDYQSWPNHHLARAPGTHFGSTSTIRSIPGCSGLHPRLRTRLCSRSSWLVTSLRSIACL